MNFKLLITMKIRHFIVCNLIVVMAFAQNRGLEKVPDSQKAFDTEKRIALVIGNKNYTREDSKLENPKNDADDMAEALEYLGFDVIKLTDLTLQDFKRSVDEFGRSLHKYNVAVFYYSGHGLQFEGENYLVPVDASIQNYYDIEYDCIALGRIMGKMKAANVKNNIVMLDACRNNPFPKSTGSRALVSGGLVIPNNPAGTAVIFSTEEGKTADDARQQRNGLFTGELLQHIKTPDISLSEIVSRTRLGVHTKSNGIQIPSDYNKMLGSFYFIKSDKTLENKTSDFNRLVDEAVMACNSNDRELAKIKFQEAVLIKEKHSISDERLYIYAKEYLTKANKFFAYEEFQIAKGWYEVALSIQTTVDLQNKIKLCDKKLN
jgi:hypothetical protein